MQNDDFSAAVALAPLKAFQRRTVDYVFDRLYGTEDPVLRFLVADEVGLGKTLVARGVIARTIERLWNTPKRIDILYICSNQAIAAQNLNRLNVLGRRELALPTRMTLIPLQLRDREGLDAKINFISLTPGTTFELHSATGVTQERAFLLHLLKDLVTYPRGLHNLLQVSAGVDAWNNAVNDLDLEGIDKEITERFRRSVQADQDLFQELERLCEIFPRRRDKYPPEMTKPRNKLVARLRAKLSHACVDALEPDLIIMDEFQRFRDLLHGNGDAAILAREILDYVDSDGHAARTLLLSATPYRMLTLAGDDAEAGDHHKDFLETVSFLYGRDKGPDIAAALAREMRAFRSFLHGLPLSQPAAIEARRTVEQRLRGVIARTERINTTVRRDSMLVEVPLDVSIAADDLLQAAVVAKVARVLDAPEIVEYWKSAPYLLNFMRHYKLKELLEQRINDTNPDLCEAIQAARSAMLNRKTLNLYSPLEPANGRMRAVIKEIFDAGLEKHLWIPPALPYYGDDRHVKPLTKGLIFSSWSMVPDAVAALLTYEAERRMGAGDSGQRYFDQQRARPLQFGHDQGRLAGLRALLLIYPSPRLAEIADPLAIFAEKSRTLSQEDIRDAIGKRLDQVIHLIETGSQTGSDGSMVEWALPAAIDAMSGSRAGEWLSSSGGLSSLASEDGFQEHVAELNKARTARDFGSVTDDVRSLLVDIALGSPAICALRAIRRIAPELAWDDPHLLGAAAQVAWAFRTLFNQHDAVALLRRGADDRYWHRVLTYSVDHNLQAVLDEYAHYLVEAEGLMTRTPEERVAGVAKAMATALSIRPSQIDVDEPRVKSGALAIRKFQMRGRFAMRLADYRDEEGAVARLGAVRDAFNSPFRPFVLATTSIGQEGLDFHPYCYRIYHWNLPGNPVELEQREGRIHRFKSHAIRLNLAERQGLTIRGSGQAPDDPWKFMFDRARSEAIVDSDIIPYWIYEGSVQVERRVPLLPFSREVARLDWLKRSLVIYRLAFGQPRQDDLLQYLHSLAELKLDPAVLASLQISLEPHQGRREYRGRPSSLTHLA